MLKSRGLYYAARDPVRPLEQESGGVILRWYGLEPPGEEAAEQRSELSPRRGSVLIVNSFASLGLQAQ